MGNSNEVFSIIQKIILSIADSVQKKRGDYYKTYSSEINRFEKKSEKELRNNPQQLAQARTKVKIAREKLERLQEDIENYNSKREVFTILNELKQARNEYVTRKRLLENESYNCNDYSEQFEYQNEIEECEMLINELDEQINLYEKLMSQYRK